MERIRHRNVLTRLELLRLVAQSCNIKLQQEDVNRLEKLRHSHKLANGGDTLNYATQAYMLQNTERVYAPLAKFIGNTLPSTSLYTAWNICDHILGRMWIAELLKPLPRRPLQPDLDPAPANPRFLDMRSNSSMDGILYSDLFASSTSFDPALARLMDQSSWRAKVDQAAASALVQSAREPSQMVGKYRIHEGSVV
ncbi:hypothetical protein CC86DRAFT_382644 [Ophiobolus disseminans]|uniref:Uncharacterized protein n=1 Tax=Ophiobolus disseminans TaxID=1469910 RepID=A0A6A6ZXP0_9PLEO|nr:hypothetical protein CC86DRAFT_382644 [Ophiobolus disseminans]